VSWAKFEAAVKAAGGSVSALVLHEGDVIEEVDNLRVEIGGQVLTVRSVWDYGTAYLEVDSE
jgi:hypothetical protein